MDLDFPQATIGIVPIASACIEAKRLAQFAGRAATIMDFGPLFSGATLTIKRSGQPRKPPPPRGAIVETLALPTAVSD